MSFIRHRRATSPNKFECRNVYLTKSVEVPDGAVLYTDKQIEINEVDQSYTRMHFLLGRYEKTAGEFYQEYVDNNHLFKDEPIKRRNYILSDMQNGL